MLIDKQFIKICTIDDLKENLGKRFIIDNSEIAVFKVEGEIYALSNICPHQKSAIIFDGLIECGKVICPAHGWEFDLATGNQAGGRRGLTSYPVFIHGRDVYIKMIEKDINW